VWQHPNLSKIVVVDSDGNISLPSVSVVKAEGLSVQNLADLITRKLEIHIPKPHVTVVVSGTNSFPKPPHAGRQHPSVKRNVVLREQTFDKSAKGTRPGLRSMRPQSC
jgi:Polysaccharide biosynthesis/export protein